MQFKIKITGPCRYEYNDEKSGIDTKIITDAVGKYLREAVKAGNDPMSVYKKITVSVEAVE
ncbi:MAG: hypothetical protein JW754_06000 [Candidatus Aenigmarchaeota archaeon]|nr:hypothetical protein [Candidatus Aenigmarchaeota archaeon]